MMRTNVFTSIVLAVMLAPNAAVAEPIVALSAQAITQVAGYSCLQTGTTAANCGAMFTYPDPYLPGYSRSASVTDRAEASFSSLFADTKYMGATGPGSTVEASASFTDILTLTGGTGAGLLEYVFSGTFGAASDLSVFGLLISHNGSTPTGNRTNSGLFVPTQAYQYISPLFPFEWGKPFVLTASILSRTFAIGSDYALTTTTFGGLRVYDPQGNRVTDYSVTRASDVTAVPEPGSVVLVLSGLGLLWQHRRSRRCAHLPGPER